MAIKFLEGQIAPSSSMGASEFSTVIQKEMHFDRIARQILNSNSMSNAERQKAWSELLKQRAVQIEHLGCRNGGKWLNLNIKQIDLAPSLQCPAYKNMHTPTISTYNFIATNIANVRLDNSSLNYVPSEILQKLGDLTGKEVDLFWTAVDADYIKNSDRPYNLVVHHWAHPHALPGDDVQYDVNLGFYPEFGFEPAHIPGSIAFNNMSPMHVHTHPSAFDKNYMLYSPDNAHFQPVLGSPFGVMWIAAQKDNRIMLTKMLVIFDIIHPISSSLNYSMICPNLSTHLDHLKKIPGAVDETFEEVVSLFKEESPEAMGKFKELPLAFQYGVYKEVWSLFGRPQGVHADFGKASFENNSAVSHEFQCDHAHRVEAICNYKKKLCELLCDSQIELMLFSQPLVKGDNVLKLMKCAEMFQVSNEHGAIDAFNQFSAKEKDAVYLAIWELSGSPRGNSQFGQQTFFDRNIDKSLKVNAILLAASRIAPSFDSPLPAIPVIDQKSIANLNHYDLMHQQLPAAPFNGVLNVVTDWKQTAPSLNSPNDSLSLIADSSTHSANMPSSSAYSTTLDQAFESNVTTISVLTPEQVLEALNTLAFNGELSKLGISERKSRIMDTFNHLPQEMKNAIYGKVYEYSEDSSKEGKSWGEEHVADDLGALILALNEVLANSVSETTREVHNEKDRELDAPSILFPNGNVTLAKNFGGSSQDNFVSSPTRTDSTMPGLEIDLSEIFKDDPFILLPNAELIFAKELSSRQDSSVSTSAYSTTHETINRALTPFEVMNALETLAFSGELSNLEISERKSRIMDIFRHLPQEMKNAIYGRVYEYSEDPSKGGESWGEHHVADNLNALILALSDVLGNN